MSRIKLRGSKLKSGDLAEIIEDIGCIPAGVYNLEAKETGFFHFGINDTAVFGVSKEYKKLIKKVDKSKSATTPPGEFIRRYYALLAESAAKLDLAFAPPTYCAVDPRALKYLKEGFGEGKVH